MVNWKSISKKSLGKYRIFEIFEEILINPRNSYKHKFYYLDLSDWTVIVPVTKNKEIVMIKQFRVAAKKTFYEFPGGLIDKDETPIDAAKREMLEETGYDTKNIKFLAEGYPIPAFQTSKCTLFLATDCTKKDVQKLDEAENIEVVLFSIEEVKEMFYNNKLDNAIMSWAFALFLLKFHLID